MVETVLASKKPAVMVMINGGIIAIDDLKDKVDGILEAFMPGVQGAQAVAEALFGVFSPGGKMPVTTYHSDIINQTDFLSMDMNNGPGRSYRYYTGTPLFEFGFGLRFGCLCLTVTD